MKQWYEELFTGYASTYDRESFTQGTLAEVDFLENEAGRRKHTAILDIGCGTGRHAIELARRGYRVTGLDLSEDQLARARVKAAAAGVQVEFLRRDARDFRFRRRFGLAIMLCEGAFPLMETDEMNFRILRNAAAALEPGGRLVMTTTNALFPLFHSVKDLVNAEPSGTKYADLSFDFLTFRERASLNVTDDAGNVKRLESNERYYTAPELAWLLRQAGFTEVEIFGCMPGQFSRERRLTPDDYEMMAIATLP